MNTDNSIMPFSKLFIKRTTNTETNTNTDADVAAAWLFQELGKTELPTLPHEVLRHILYFVPDGKRTDAVRIGRYVAITMNNEPTVKKGRPPYAYVMWENNFIYANKENDKRDNKSSLDEIHVRTFGSEALEWQKLYDLESGVTTIKDVLELPC